MSGWLTLANERMRKWGELDDLVAQALEGDELNDATARIQQAFEAGTDILPLSCVPPEIEERVRHLLVEMDAIWRVELKARNEWLAATQKRRRVTRGV
jgi:hypothetical protein